MIDPGLAVLEEGFLYTLHALGASIHLADSDEAQQGEDAARLRADFLALRKLLDRGGLTVVPPDDPHAGMSYARFRGATDPYIRAYARNIGYEPEAIWATYGRWLRGSALESPVEAESQRASTPTGA